MIANPSQADRTVRCLPDSHPNRPSRPVPTRPLSRCRSLASHRYLGRLASATTAPGFDVACDAFGGDGGWVL